MQFNFLTIISDILAKNWIYRSHIYAICLYLYLETLPEID